MPLLSAAVEEWASEKSRTSWVEKTEREHRLWMQHFIDIAGDRLLSEYTKADGRIFKSILLKLPANWNKIDELKGLSLGKAADRASHSGFPPMSDNNVNKLIGFVSSFWNWADSNFDDVSPNPFKGLKIKVRRQAREERDPFSIDELSSIFKAPIYTGCKSVRAWKQIGTLIPKDAGIFWVPLISLFSGMRMGEIIQLYTGDIREEEGILFFDINGDGEDKRLKTANSKRFIPVHHSLCDMGFKDFVEHQRKLGHTRLFPDLKMGNDGYYSSPFSKHFRRFLESVGVKNRKNAFHSFRHCFEDACRNSDVPKEVMDALQGHGEQGMSSRYGRGYHLQKLNEEMQKVRYRGLNLGYLEV